jgi:hypothetical protein
MIEAPTASDKDTDAAFLPTPLRGKRKVKSMRTPGMGAMLGAPRPRGNLSSVGKIEPGALPFDEPQKMAKGGSVSASKRADGCCVRGKTKGKMV